MAQREKTAGRGYFDPGACAYSRQGRFHGEIKIVFTFMLALLLATLVKTSV